MITELLELIAMSLYFFLPAYLANMAPIIFRWVPWLRIPIHEKKFGKNKTWRGIVAAALMGAFVFSLQKLAYQNGFKLFALIDYSDFSIILGFLMGLGAIVGDLVESYYKRKQNIPPGKPWLPWDQLDFVFGAIFFGLVLYVPPAEVILVLILASPLLHILFNLLGYLLKIKKTKL
ncbi:CDP-archaeol synthase [Candidatus Woesearchaeota archaeon]|nr:CDP-archaeol synthase [Candidatus Woesearchaeota archaeon]